MPNQRIPSIDQFRGCAILTMVLANFMGGIRVIPDWLKHTPDIGLTVIDLIAPLFIFAIGLTYGLSFRRRLEREGAAKTYPQFALRYLAILGLGAVMSAGETALGYNQKGVDWGVLQAIGAAGILTLLVIRQPTWIRVAGGLLLLAVYQGLLDTLWLETVLAAPHGGLYGSLSWTGMLILSTTLADLFHHPERRKWVVWISLLVLAVGLAWTFFSPLSKNRVSSSYVLVSLGISALLFLGFHWANARMKWKARFLVVWGANPLVLYFLHYIFIGLVFLPEIPFLYADAPLWLALLEMGLMVAGISAAAYWLERRKLVISL